MGRDRLREHARVEFPWLAIRVEIGPGEVRPDHRRAQSHGATEQFIDIAVLRTADGIGVQPCHGQEALGIEPAAVGRTEDEGNPLFRRSQNVDRRDVREIFGRSRHLEPVPE